MTGDRQPTECSGGTGVLSIRGLDHLVLRAREPDRLADFYVRVLGCTEERRVPEVRLIQLRAGASLIDILAADGAPWPGEAPPDPATRNLDHFCLRLASFDESAIRRHLAAFGIAAGEVAMRYGAEGFGPSLYLQDPEGNTVELKGGYGEGAGAATSGLAG